MKFEGRVIKDYAKKAFKANYWPMVGICLLFTIIVGVVAGLSAIPVVGILISVIVTPVLEVSFLLQMYWTYHSGETPTPSHLFEGFKEKRIWHIVGGYWYMVLFTFLWTLLFVIPGFVKSIAYSMTPYILMDQPEISATDALKKSMAMTDGYKWKIFVFELSFIGWAILASITLGIVGIFYVFPYYYLAMAGIYDFLKSNDSTAYVENTSETVFVEE